MWRRWRCGDYWRTTYYRTEADSAPQHVRSTMLKNIQAVSSTVRCYVEYSRRKRRLGCGAGAGTEGTEGVHSTDSSSIVHTYIHTKPSSLSSLPPMSPRFYRSSGGQYVGTTLLLLYSTTLIVLCCTKYEQRATSRGWFCSYYGYSRVRVQHGTLCANAMSINTGALVHLIIIILAPTATAAQWHRL